LTVRQSALLDQTANLMARSQRFGIIHQGPFYCDEQVDASNICDTVTRR
jgi:hypothetical protein